jgi:hypothetical protein
LLCQKFLFLYIIIRQIIAHLLLLFRTRTESLEIHKALLNFGYDLSGNRTIYLYFRRVTLITLYVYLYRGLNLWESSTRTCILGLSKLHILLTNVHKQWALEEEMILPTLLEENVYLCSISTLARVQVINALAGKVVLCHFFKFLIRSFMFLGDH